MWHDGSLGKVERGNAEYHIFPITEFSSKCGLLSIDTQARVRHRETKKQGGYISFFAPKSIQMIAKNMGVHRPPNGRKLKQGELLNERRITMEVTKNNTSVERCVDEYPFVQHIGQQAHDVVSQEKQKNKKALKGELCSILGAVPVRDEEKGIERTVCIRMICKAGDSQIRKDKLTEFNVNRSSQRDRMYSDVLVFDNQCRSSWTDASAVESAVGVLNNGFADRSASQSATQSALSQTALSHTASRRISTCILACSQMDQNEFNCSLELAKILRCNHYKQLWFNKDKRARIGHLLLSWTESALVRDDQIKIVLAKQKLVGCVQKGWSEISRVCKLLVERQNVVPQDVKMADIVAAEHALDELVRHVKTVAPDIVSKTDMNTAKLRSKPTRKATGTCMYASKIFTFSNAPTVFAIGIQKEHDDNCCVVNQPHLQRLPYELKMQIVQMMEEHVDDIEICSRLKRERTSEDNKRSVVSLNDIKNVRTKFEHTFEVNTNTNIVQLRKQNKKALAAKDKVIKEKDQRIKQMEKKLRKLEQRALDM